MLCIRISYVCAATKQFEHHRDFDQYRVVCHWGGQLGVASWGWLQSPLFIVCLKAIFFSKSFL
jgi:hypothetical protein